MTMTTGRVAIADLSTVYDELSVIYATAETDPSNHIICPNFNPLPIPTLADCEAHVGSGGEIVTVRDSGALINFCLLRSGVLRAAFGVYDPPTTTAATFGPGGMVEWCRNEYGAYRLNTGTRGFVARQWIEDYVLHAGTPYDLADTTHPGLGGQTLAAFDQVEWELIIDDSGHRYVVGG